MHFDIYIMTLRLRGNIILPQFTRTGQIVIVFYLTDEH